MVASFQSNCSSCLILLYLIKPSFQIGMKCLRDEMSGDRRILPENFSQAEPTFYKTIVVFDAYLITITHLSHFSFCTQKAKSLYLQCRLFIAN